MSKSKAANTGIAAEFKRQFAVVDQSLSMHASLRDGYEKRAFWLNTSQIGVTLFLCVVSFVGDGVFETLGFDAMRTRILLGCVATVVLLLAITEFRVDWKSRATIHRDAVRILGSLKAEYRKARR